MCEHTHVSTYTHEHAHTSTHVHTYIYMSTHMSTYARVSTHVSAHVSTHTRDHTREQGAAVPAPALLLWNQVPRQGGFEEGAFQSKVGMPGLSPAPHPLTMAAARAGDTSSQAAKQL